MIATSPGLSDWLPIVAVILAALLSLLGAMALVILNSVNGRLEKVEGHLTSLVAAQTPLAMRNELVEEFLEAELGYRPPKRGAREL